MKITVAMNMDMTTGTVIHAHTGHTLCVNEHADTINSKLAIGKSAGRFAFQFDGGMRQNAYTYNTKYAPINENSAIDTADMRSDQLMIRSSCSTVDGTSQ